MNTCLSHHLLTKAGEDGDIHQANCADSLCCTNQFNKKKIIYTSKCHYKPQITLQFTNYLIDNDYMQLLALKYTESITE